MNLKPEEISSVIKEQIKRYAAQLEVADVGYGFRYSGLYDSVFEPAV